jgi:hypothetical protein
MRMPLDDDLTYPVRALWEIYVSAALTQMATTILMR